MPDKKVRLIIEGKFQLDDKDLKKFRQELIEITRRYSKIPAEELRTRLEETTKAVKKQESAFRSLVWTVVRAEIVYRGIMRVVRATYDVYASATKAIEDHKITVMALAAIETSYLNNVVKNARLASDAYSLFKQRADAIYQTMQQIAATTPLTGEQVARLAQALLAYGQNLDIHNQKVIAGIRSLANAIAILTKGQRVNLQIMQETRALLTGVGIQYSELYRLMVQTNPALAEQIKLWARQGRLLEHLPEVLSGFNIASKEMMKTVQGLWTTFRSLFRLNILEPAFKRFHQTLTQVIDRFLHFLFVIKETASGTVVIEGLTEAGKKLKTTLEEIAKAGSFFIKVFERAIEVAIKYSNAIKMLATALATAYIAKKILEIASAVRALRIALASLSTLGSTPIGLLLTLGSLAVGTGIEAIRQAKEAHQQEFQEWVNSIKQGRKSVEEELGNLLSSYKNIAITAGKMQEEIWQSLTQAGIFSRKTAGSFAVDGMITRFNSLIQQYNLLSERRTKIYQDYVRAIEKLNAEREKLYKQSEMMPLDEEIDKKIEIINNEIKKTTEAYQKQINAVNQTVESVGKQIEYYRRLISAVREIVNYNERAKASLSELKEITQELVKRENIYYQYARQLPHTKKELFEIEKEHVEYIIKQQIDLIDAEKKYHQELINRLKILETLAKTDEERDKIQQTIKQHQSEIDKLNEREITLRKQLVYTEKQYQLNVAKTYDLHTMLVYSITKLRDQWLNVAKQIHDTIIQNITRLRDFIADTLYDAFTGKLDSIKDVWHNFLQYLIHSWLRTVATIAANAIVINVVAPAFGFSIGGKKQGTAGFTFSPVNFLTNIKQGFGNFFNLPASIFEWAFDKTGWYALGRIAEFFQSGIGSAVGAGLMGMLGSLFTTGKITSAITSGLGAGLGFAIGGPIGGAIGGIIGGIASALGFGHHKKHKPRINIFGDDSPYQYVSFTIRQMLAQPLATNLWWVDVDHMKHEKKIQRNIRIALSKVFRQVTSLWQTVYREIDKAFGTNFEQYLLNLRFFHYRLRWTGKHAGEKFQNWLKNEFPQMLSSLYVDAIKQGLAKYVADWNKFNKWLQDLKNQIKKTKTEDLGKVLEGIKTQLVGILTFLKSSQAVIALYQQSTQAQRIQAYIDTMEAQIKQAREIGLATASVQQAYRKNVLEYIETVWKLQTGQMTTYDLTIQYFKKMYPSLYQQLAGKSGEEIIAYIKTHLSYLQSLAGQYNVSFGKLVGDLYDLAIALNNSGSSLNETFENLNSTIKELDNFIRSLVGEYSIYPEQKLAVMERQRQILYQQALSGSKHAIQEYEQFIRTYLSNVKKYVATPEEYSNITASVFKQLHNIRQTIKPYPIQHYWHRIGTITHQSGCFVYKYDIYEDKATGVVKKIFKGKEMLDVCRRHFRTTLLGKYPLGFLGVSSWPTNIDLWSLGGGPKPIILDTIYQFQTGGIVTSPTHAIIAEGNKPEAVLPLPYGERTMDVLFARLERLERENSYLLKENRELRAELRQILIQLLKTSRENLKLQEKWDIIGMPPVRSET